MDRTKTYDVVVDLISGKIKQVRDDALIYAGLETNLEPHGKAMHPAETPYEFCKALENFPLVKLPPCRGQ